MIQEGRALTTFYLRAGVVSLTSFHYNAAHAVEASWRSGYAEDCKSLHPSSILGEASKIFGLLELN